MFSYNVSSVLEHDGFIKEIDEEAVIEGIDDGIQKVDLIGPTHLKGQFENIGKELIAFTGMLESTLSIPCSRCNKLVNDPISVALDYRFTLNEADADGEHVYLLNGHTVDLYENVIEEIKIMIPMSILCDTNCKGLCSECGVNLNEHNCTCESSNIDPRFAVLKDLFNKD